MDKKKSVLNVSVSVGFRVITMVMVIVVKRMLIRACGNEVNGLNALYLSIVGFLSVAELGIGSAITFCMYKPIVEGDNKKVSALYGLFHRVYCIIGLVIFAAGLLLSPFIHHFAADYEVLNINLSTTFILMLISVVLTYFFSAKTSLFNAYKNNYITTAITSGGIVLQYLLQIATLYMTQSFTWYLMCRIITACVQWIVTELLIRKRYGAILITKVELDIESRKELRKNIKAMFMHKVGTLLVNTADSMIISAFVGVVALGEYSNYAAIMTAMTGVISLLFSSLTSVFGHLYVQSSHSTTRKYCEAFHLLNFLVGIVFYLGYFAIIDNLVALLFSPTLLIGRSVSFVITLNGFVQFMRSSVLAFRDATGTFYYDRWKPLAEGGINVILSILLVKWIGVVGVLVATVITNLIICHIVEPYVLYKHAFRSSPGKYFAKNYSLILLFGAALVCLNFCMQDRGGYWANLFINGFISLGVSAVVAGSVLLIYKPQLSLLMKRARRK